MRRDDASRECERDAREAEEASRVPTSHACPCCQNDEIELLAWDDDGETLTCGVCHTNYVPG